MNVIVIPGEVDAELNVMSIATEELWAATLGPTAMLAVRRLVRMAGGIGLTCPFRPADLAVSLGVSESRVRRAINRLVRFGPVTIVGQTVVVPLKWPTPPERES